MRSVQLKIKRLIDFVAALTGWNSKKLAYAWAMTSGFLSISFQNTCPMLVPGK